MTNQPLVTILMPTYRRPHYLRQALGAAVAQTYRNLQIIVRDNASGDQTPEVVAEFGDSRIEFHQASQTVNASENGAECLRRARGKYCMTLADDDLVEPNFVEVLATALEENPDVAIAYAAAALIDETGAVLERKSAAGSYTVETLPFLMAWCKNELPLFTPASLLMKVDSIREITASIQNDRFHEGHNADNAFMIWIALRGRVFFTDATAYSYRVHQGNTCMRMSSRQSLAGDKALLHFIDEEKRGRAGARLTAKEWRQFEAAAAEHLAKTYYWRLLNKELESYGWLDAFSNLFFYPAKAFGAALTVRMLLANRGPLKSWLKGRLNPGLARSIGSLRRVP